MHECMEEGIYSTKGFFHELTQKQYADIWTVNQTLVVRQIAKPLTEQASTKKECILIPHRSNWVWILVFKKKNKVKQY